MNEAWSQCSKTTTDTRNKLSQGSNPNFSSGTFNISFLFVFLLADYLITMIKVFGIEEITQKLTPEAMANCADKNALLVAMEVC